MSGNSNANGLLSNNYTKIIIIIHKVVKHEVKAGGRGSLVEGHWHDVPMLPVNEESLLNRSHQLDRTTNNAEGCINYKY